MDNAAREKKIFLTDKMYITNWWRNVDKYVSPFDMYNSSMINGHFTYLVKNVVSRPQQVKPHACALIALLIIYLSWMEPNNQTTYQFIVLCQFRQRKMVSAVEADKNGWAMVNKTKWKIYAVAQSPADDSREVLKWHKIKPHSVKTNYP